jgi:hypothetical protein
VPSAKSVRPVDALAAGEDDDEFCPLALQPVDGFRL